MGLFFKKPESESGSAKFKLSMSQKNTVMFLMAMILAVTFEHSYTILSYFTNGFMGQVSTIGLVLWLDFMLFFSLSMFQRQSSRWRRFFGWLVFIVIVMISGFLNIYYLWHHRPTEFSQLIAQFLSIAIGGVSPLGIVFLGIVNSSAQETIATVTANKARSAERKERMSEASEHRLERDRKIIELKQQGLNNSQIVRRLNEEGTRVSRPTVIAVIKRESGEVS